MPNTTHEPIEVQDVSDPFSVEFLQKADNEMKIVEVSADFSTRVRRRRGVQRDKFIIHRELKNRLLKLRETNVSDDVKTIIDDILSLKYVPTEGKYCNYLGFSQADFTKISYLDKERETRLKDEVVEVNVIKPGTVLKLYKKRSYQSISGIPFFTQHLKLTSRHLDNRIYPISEFKETTKEFNYIAYTDNGRQEFTSSISFMEPFLKTEGDVFRLLHSRLMGSGYFSITTEGLYIQENSWHNLLGVSLDNTKMVIKGVWDSKRRYHTSVGKIIRRLFGNKYNDRQVSEFSEAYAALITVSNPIYNFCIESGEAIKAAYFEDNYYRQSNTLGSSCMRHYRCQDYFDMYVKNPDLVKIALLKRGNKIAARSLMWLVEGKWGFDRIYSMNHETEILLRNTLTAQDYPNYYGDCDLHEIEIDLDEVETFPYLDTFRYYDTEYKILRNREPKGNVPYLTLSCTGGDYYSHNGARERSRNTHNTTQYFDCACCGDEVSIDNSYYINIGRYADDRVCPNCAVCDEYTDDYFTTEDHAVDLYDGYVTIDYRAVRLADGTYAHERDGELRRYNGDFGYFILGRNPVIEMDDSFYHPDDPSLTPTENLTENLTENIVEAVIETSTMSQYIPNPPSLVTYPASPEIIPYLNNTIFNSNVIITSTTTSTSSTTETNTNNNLNELL